ncbi:MAG: hypothetical protein ACE5G8_15710 [Anaerolineae bacterium]
MERKLKGILCHATQMSDSGPFAGEYDPTEEPWFHTEMFIRARSLVDVGPGVETDLFAGLP